MGDRRRLGEILVAEAIVSAETLARALADQQSSQRKHRIGQILLEYGAIESDTLLRALGLQHRVPVVDPLAISVHPPTLWRIPRDVAERGCALLAEHEGRPLLVLGDARIPGVVRTIASHLGL